MGPRYHHSGSGRAEVLALALAVALLAASGALDGVVPAASAQSTTTNTTNATNCTAHHGKPRSHVSIRRVYVEENYDVRGNPGMVPCAATDEHMQGFYAETMERDMEVWRQSGPVGLELLRSFVQAFVQESQWSPQNFIMVHDNQWYYPFHEDWNPRQYPRPHADIRPGGKRAITLWISASEWYFTNATDAGRIGDWPNTLFFFSDQDSGQCNTPERCRIPVFSISKNVSDPARTDLLIPFMYDIKSPLFNLPFQLKRDRAFFRGRPNYGYSFKTFNGTKYFSRLHYSNLSLSHGDTLDAGFVISYPGFPVLPEAPMAEHALFKYVLHLDGVTYSARLSRLMHTDSVVLKEESVWHEYFVRAMKEGVHYLPIMKTGPDDVFDVLESYRNRTADLRRIAWDAQQFVLRYLCPHARLLYLRRLLREYNRLIPDMQSFIDNEMVPLLMKRKTGEANLEQVFQYIKQHDVTKPFQF